MALDQLEAALLPIFATACGSYVWYSFNKLNAVEKSVSDKINLLEQNIIRTEANIKDFAGQLNQLTNERINTNASRLESLERDYKTLNVDVSKRKIKYYHNFRSQQSDIIRLRDLCKRVLETVGAKLHGVKLPEVPEMEGLPYQDTITEDFSENADD